MFESSFWILPRQGENSKGDFLEIQSRHDRPDHEGMVYAASSKPAHDVVAYRRELSPVVVGFVF